jgi:hypothetical protein
MQQIVYPNGCTKVVIPANESIAIYSKGVTTVRRVLGFPNHPDAKSVIGSVNNQQTVFGPYTTGATILIEPGATPALYSVGVAPVVDSLYASQYQGDPVALNATGAVTAAAILGGIVTSTTAAAVAGTVPTGAVMDLASDWAIGDSVDWSVIATGANAFTVTAAASGHTLVGTAVVATLTSGLFRTRKTAADTFITYRLS